MGRNKVRLVNKNNMKLYYYLQRSSQNLVFEINLPISCWEAIFKKKKTYSY